MSESKHNRPAAPGRGGVATWGSDAELFDLCRRELYTAVVGDIMDQVGLDRQFLPPRVRPMDSATMLVGRAMTVLEADCVEGERKTASASSNPALHQPFGLMLDALDDLKRDEVYLCSGASPSYALWGELMSCRAIACGAAGAVVNGYHRDTKGIEALGFPTFSHGPYAQDQAPRGKVIDWRCDLLVGDVRVRSGDIVVGDIDGVCIVPRDREREVFMKALEKARGEKTVKQAIQGGMTAREAFERYGIM